MFSLVIPVYRNEGSIPELLEQLEGLSRRLPEPLEVVFVIDGSPDRSHAILAERLRAHSFAAQLLRLSRNFGSFAAIRAGIAKTTGTYFAVMAADLQEPIELVEQFFYELRKGEVDVVVGTRRSRQDPWLTKLASRFFWYCYRTLVQPEVPAGGVDVFGGNALFRDNILALRELNSSMIGLLFWLGFRRRELPYERAVRRHGKSAWTVRRKLRYLMNSVFSFSDLPIVILTTVGAIGIFVSGTFAAVVLAARLAGQITVPGYTVTILVTLFSCSIQCLGMGLLGSYLWRTFENTKGRPEYLVQDSVNFRGRQDVVLRAR